MNSYTAAERDQAFLQRYTDLVPFLNQWGTEVYVQLTDLSADMKPDNRLQILSPFRLKSNESLLGKAFHRGYSYGDSSLESDSLSEKINTILREITDKIGVRIVLLTREDADEAFERIYRHTNWQTTVTRDLRSAILEQPETFVYASHHVVVKPKVTSQYNPDYLPFLTCEIQIRSLLQHTFAEISHDNFYKGPYQHDRELIRILARSQAGMETTDEMFMNIFNMMRDPNRTYARYIHDLTGLYQQYNAGFTARQVDHRVTDQYFSLLAKKKVDIQELKEFVHDYERDIRSAIRYNTEVYLFRQPIVLLLAYYAYNYSDFLERESELSAEDFQALKTGLNISTQYD